MAIYGLSDLHLAKSVDKPMDVFSNAWENYMDRIRENWEKTVGPDDTVLVAGDISWATYLTEIRKDFEFIDSLPGHKILSRGNHDYWWTTVKKMERYIGEEGFSSFAFLQNRAMEIGDVLVGATRGWMLPGDAEFHEDDRKIFDREVIRLDLCIKDMDRIDPLRERKRILMIHYPPKTKFSGGTRFTDVIEEGGIDLCVYGHLHGHGHKNVIEEEGNGTLYRCISSDYVGFMPVRLDELLNVK